jgi:hypothetical protein
MQIVSSTIKQNWATFRAGSSMNSATAESPVRCVPFLTPYANQMLEGILNPSEDYEQEDFSNMAARYSGFGSQLYEKLKDALPITFDKLTFYRNIRHQNEHSYAVYRDGAKSFAIQLDPICEVIVLWNLQYHIEIGAWSKDGFLDAIQFIKTTLQAEQE